MSSDLEKLTKLREIQTEIEKTEATIAIFEELVASADLADGQFLSDRLEKIEEQTAAWGTDMISLIPPDEVKA